MAAGLLGFGARFANVLPDLAADRATGVGGLPQRVATRWGPGGVRAVALVLLLTASALLLLAATRRWVVVPGLIAVLLLAVASARGNGRVPFLAAIGIAAVDIGCDSLCTGLRHKVNLFLRGAVYSAGGRHCEQGWDS